MKEPTNSKYTIWSIVCEASCHPVIWSSGHTVIQPSPPYIRSYGHMVIWSFSHLVIRSSSPVLRSSSHLVIQPSSPFIQSSGHQSPGHPVIWSSCHPVILSSCHPVILSSYHLQHYYGRTNNIRGYRSALQTNILNFYVRSSILLGIFGCESIPNKS